MLVKNDLYSDLFLKRTSSTKGTKPGLYGRANSVWPDHFGSWRLFGKCGTGGSRPGGPQRGASNLNIVLPQLAQLKLPSPFLSTMDSRAESRSEEKKTKFQQRKTRVAFKNIASLV